MTAAFLLGNVLSVAAVVVVSILVGTYLFWLRERDKGPRR